MPLAGAPSGSCRRRRHRCPESLSTPRSRSSPRAKASQAALYRPRAPFSGCESGVQRSRLCSRRLILGDSPPTATAAAGKQSSPRVADEESSPCHSRAPPQDHAAGTDIDARNPCRRHGSSQARGRKPPRPPSTARGLLFQVVRAEFSNPGSALQEVDPRKQPSGGNCSSGETVEPAGGGRGE